MGVALVRIGLGVVGTSLLLGSAFADSSHAVPYGIGEYGSTMVGLTQGQRVSGSKVEFEIRFRHAPVRNEPGLTGDTWAHARWHDVELKLGSEVIDTYAGFVPANEVLMFRFTAWPFVNGDPIAITAAAKVDLGRWEGATWIPFEGASTNLSYEHVYTVQAHHKLQLLGTGVGPGQPPTPSKGFEDTSDAITYAAYTKLFPPCHPDPQPEAPARSESAAAVLGKLTESTVFVGVTHGSPAGITSSNGLEPVPFIAFSGQDGVSARTGEKAAAGIPFHSIVALYSCHTLSSDNFGPKAFRVLDFGSGAIIPDRAYLGFAENVSGGLWPGSAWTNLPKGQTQPSASPTHGIQEHAFVLLNLLQGGFVVDDALASANVDYPPVYEPVPGSRQFTKVIGGMLRRGDPWARRRGVYLGLPRPTF
ncbi:MAG: hypothetical protein KIS66_03550 [Fimbriimonadaceae bacterium]|nr:hypothetical protein [Fimbriimonadaceae bacterium]